MIDRARMLPGQINYGTPGDASTAHLTGELFRAMSGPGVDLRHQRFSAGCPTAAAREDQLPVAGFHVRERVEQLRVHPQHVAGNAA